MVAQGLASTTEEAKKLIMTGDVVSHDRQVRSAGELLSEAIALRFRKKKKDPHTVGRGYFKLKGALTDLQLEQELSGKIVLDIGASTGGFVQCAIDHQAKLVIALDVGVNQLAWKLRQHPQVISIEKTDIRNFTHELSPQIEWILGDISFNSLARLASSIKNASQHPQVRYLLLVKPQFELDSFEIGDGIVRSDELRMKALKLVQKAFADLGAKSFRWANSQVAGHKGNQEIFLLIDF
jgi:23S rRNA (cytidine1920-2'-O)/16S rRNA (cytidine1409-2'-O)-methyltransferase